MTHFRINFLEAEHLNFVDKPVPLSAISFYSAPLHKKDAAAIGASLETSVLRKKIYERGVYRLQKSHNFATEKGKPDKRHAAIHCKALNAQYLPMLIRKLTHFIVQKSELKILILCG